MKKGFRVREAIFMGFDEGNIVKRKSYGEDVIFRVAGKETDEIGRQIYLLKGIHQRLIADAFEDDLIEATEEDIKIQSEKFARQIKGLQSNTGCNDIIYG